MKDTGHSSSASSRSIAGQLPWASAPAWPARHVIPVRRYVRYLKFLSLLGHKAAMRHNIAVDGTTGPVFARRGSHRRRWQTGGLRRQ
jgi:hypothetical protein